MENQYDVIVMGAGPAGLAAGIYLSRAKLKTLILNEGTVGGQLVLTHEIANYPGVESTSGYQLGMTMKKQAEEFGCDIKAFISVKSFNIKADMKSVELTDGSIYQAKAIIFAPGGRPRTIGAMNEDILKGRGISYCATCDGDFFTDKEIVVVGGGNSALEEAVKLTNYASKVTLIHMLDHFQAFRHAVKEVEEHPKIEIRMQSKIVEFKGDQGLNSVVIEDVANEKRYEYPTDGAFIFIGYLPNTENLRGLIELNENGEIIVDDSMHTSVPGVFAAGDSIAKKYRQVTTAVADGTIAALAAADYLRQETS